MRLHEQLRAAAQIVLAVSNGRSLAAGLLKDVSADARPLVQDIVFGVLRAGEAAFARLGATGTIALPVACLLRCALYRLDTWPDRAHIVVSEAVKAAPPGGPGRLVNAVLRNYLRHQLENECLAAENPAVIWQHPRWWIDKVRRDYPEDWKTILATGNQHPPLALRVNVRQISPDDYLDCLTARGLAGQRVGPVGILLDKPVPARELPGFFEGWVSVQDLGAQEAIRHLSPPPGSAVLDACAAPGGKAAHLLEAFDIRLTAMDLDAKRLRQVRESFARLGLSGETVQGDAATWAEGSFEAILADVPCSASGIVRRQPDIKWLRRETDIARFAAQQKRILDNLWQRLKPGGALLYATCSVFPEENTQQIAAFLPRHPEATLTEEKQLLPCAHHDGFYYARLVKAHLTP
ncbi:MAG: 16S rRNA (cytosine(967)-C(5))-methyltransferase RsmB [Zoogloeaceae bacterium]|nr:16S rRNA (cytosine(967)-C(5))-methyltransferase RsmB [Zoogloeaceae bacterium]